MPRNNSGKQNVTISISRETVRKARVLAARRSTSISGLLAEQIEALIGAEETWERAERSALALLEQGFALGGQITSSRAGAERILSEDLNSGQIIAGVSIENPFSQPD